MAPIKSVPERLREYAELYHNRNTQYGASYHHHGAVLRALFPFPLTLEEERDHTRFGLLTMMVSKLTRYCRAFFGTLEDRQDSLQDLSVYAAMLAEVDELPVAKSGYKAISNLQRTLVLLEKGTNDVNDDCTQASKLLREALTLLGYPL